MIYGKCDIVNEEGAIAREKGQAWSLRRLLWRDYICQPATFMNAKILDQVGQLNVALYIALDWELWIRMGLVAPGRFVPCRWATARMWEGCKTFTPPTNASQEHPDIMRHLRTNLEVDKKVRREASKVLAHHCWRTAERLRIENDYRSILRNISRSFRLAPGYVMRELLPEKIMHIKQRIMHSI
jgi:hypothetical protein